MVENEFIPADDFMNDIPEGLTEAYSPEVNLSGGDEHVIDLENSLEESETVVDENTDGKEKPVETKTTEPEKEVKTDDETPFQIIAEQFKGKLFDDEDFEDEEFKFDGSEDSFMELFERKVQKEVGSNLIGIIEQLPDKFKTPIKNYIQGLDFETADTLGQKINFYKVDEQTLESYPEKAEAIYREYLKEKGFSQAKIDKLVNTAKELDELTEEAKDASKEMLEYHEKQAEAKKQELARQQEYARFEAQQKIEKFKEDLFSKKDMFGLALSEKFKKELFEEMTTPSVELPNGQKVTKIQSVINKDPQSFNLLLNYYNKIGLFNYDEKSKTFKPDLSRVKTEKLSEKLNTQVDKFKNAASKFKGGYSTPNNDLDNDSLSILKSMRKAFADEEN